MPPCPKLPKEDKAYVFYKYWLILTTGAIEPEREYLFHPTRKWRFDFAFDEQKVAVEIEGNAWQVKGGGRHMKDSDLDKYNQAALLGWRVFRFSPTMLENDPDACINLIKDALE